MSSLYLLQVHGGSLRLKAATLVKTDPTISGKTKEEKTCQCPTQLWLFLPARPTLLFFSFIIVISFFSVPHNFICTRTKYSRLGTNTYRLQRDRLILLAVPKHSGDGRGSRRSSRVLGNVPRAKFELPFHLSANFIKPHYICDEYYNIFFKSCKIYVDVNLVLLRDYSSDEFCLMIVRYWLTHL